MDKNMKATPTPWEIDPNGRQDIFGPYRGRHQLIVTAYREEHERDTIDDGAEAEANAEFIVRAVNAHDELVAAAKEVLIEWATPLVTGESLSLRRLEAALAKAEPRS